MFCAFLSPRPLPSKGASTTSRERRQEKGQLCEFVTCDCTWTALECHENVDSLSGKAGTLAQAGGSLSQQASPQGGRER